MIWAMIHKTKFARIFFQNANAFADIYFWFDALPIKAYRTDSAVL